jgi:hypothetical protein
MRRGVLITGLLWILVLVCSGCIVPSQDAIRKADGPSQDSRASQPETRAESGPLIKPIIPPEAAPTSQAPNSPGGGPMNPEPPTQTPGVNTDNPFLEKPKPRGEQPPSAVLTQPPEGQNRPAAEPTQPPGGPNRPAKQEWADQKKVRDAAVEIARVFPAVKKIKVCYQVNKDEWWVILYEQGEGIFELKQFIWNKESEKLEQHLVYKTIPVTRLQQHLSEQEPGKACEIMEPPSANPGVQPVGPGA